MANHHKGKYLIHLKLIADWISVQSVVVPNMYKALPALQDLQEIWTLYKSYVFQSRTLIPNIVHIRSQLRRWKRIVNLKMMYTPIDDGGFVLYQVKAVVNQADSKAPMIANLPYLIKQHQAPSQVFESLLGQMC